MWRGGDYVWIGSEPWGWTPYHYGRWAHAPRIGWFWVPPQRRQVYWGPGYVGWVRTRDHVAWVPLAPREVYYGYGNYGPNSVDIRKRNVREINITNITYKNVQVNNSVTIINNNSFVTGRREVVNVRENPFLTEKINVGRPDIKPEKASFAPVVKTIDPGKLPPQQVTKIAVKDLKQERRLVKEQNQSVINKGEPVKSLVVKAVEQPKSPTEKMQERQQKGASAAAGETPRVKSEEKSASSSAPPAETKATKGGSPSTPEPAAKQAESTREKAQEPRQTQMEKGKSGATVETPRAKSEEKSAAGPSKAAEVKETKGRNIPAPMSETKPSSTLEPRDRKSPRAEEKAASPVKPVETIERKSAKQSGPDDGQKSTPSSTKASKASDETKGSKQTVAEKKESREEKKAKKEELDSKGKSTETKEEKIEGKQKTRDQ